MNNIINDNGWIAPKSLSGILDLRLRSRLDSTPGKIDQKSSFQASGNLLSFCTNYKIVEKPPSSRSHVELHGLPFPFKSLVSNDPYYYHSCVVGYAARLVNFEGCILSAIIPQNTSLVRLIVSKNGNELPISQSFNFLQPGSYLMISGTYPI